MKQFILKHKKSVAGIAAVLLIGIITMSFQDTPFFPKSLGVQEIYEDTTKPKAKANQAEIDKAMKELQVTLQQLAEQMKQIDMNQINADISKALKEVDVQKIMAEVQLSLKEVDMKKIMEEVSNSLKEIDVKAINKEVQEALKEVDMNKINREVYFNNETFSSF